MCGVSKEQDDIENVQRPRQRTNNTNNVNTNMVR
jgi:hypothetical protein